MRILRSLEEFLYEVIVWLVFFPVTLWLSLRYPQRMMDHADTELGNVQADEYSDTLSPLIFLMLSIAISHAIGIALHVDAPDDKMPSLLTTTPHLLGFRVLAFSLLPLAMSLRMLRHLGVKLDRQTLRAPFYSQCFVTAPFALGVGFALSIGRLDWPYARLVELGLLGLSVGWYLRQQAHWFAAKVGVSLRRGWLDGLATFLGGLLAIIAAAVAVSGF